MSLRDCTLENPVVNSVNLCLNEVAYNAYGYNVTEWVAIVFTALFGLSALVHFIQAIRSRMWFLLFTITLCATDEFIGWGFRLWSASVVEWSPSLGGYWSSPGDAYLGQIATLIIGPAFLSAMWYVVLGRLILALGPQFSRFRPKTYTITFVVGDVTCLLVQAAGGGLAASAGKPETQKLGSNVMVAGVILQMFIMVLYSIVLVDFVSHYIKDRPVRNKRDGFNQMYGSGQSNLPHVEIKKARLLLIALVISTVLIFIRSIYRTIELLEGWNGPIITNETLFIVLDGMAVFGATAIFHFIHPGKYMPKTSSSAEDHELDDAKERLPVYDNGNGEEWRYRSQAEFDNSMQMDDLNRFQQQPQSRYN